MPEALAPWTIEDLAKAIHEARAHARDATAKMEADENVDAAILRVAEARRALELADAALIEARRPYTEVLTHAADVEAQLRQKIEEGWPPGEKTIGCATVVTRRTVDLKRGVTPADAFRKLDALLGATGALPKVVIALKVDSKAALPLVEAMPALRDVLEVEEKRTLTIRAPKEA